MTELTISKQKQGQRPLPTGMVTFLFTDIEGSTPLWDRDPEGMKVALLRHNAILNDAIAAYGGQVFKFIGDAFQAAFVLPHQALRAAVAAQRALAAEPWGAAGPLRVRMGLHVGPVQAEGRDFAPNHTLNRVARVMSAGHGGQILLTLALAELVRGRLPGSVQLKDLGRYYLKGLSQPEHLFQVVLPDLPAEFPPLNAEDSFPHNLPDPLTSFVGREKEVAELKQLLASARLVTLTGSGGVGKTRLSLQVGREVLEKHPHGVWLVELASLADPVLIPRSLASALGLRVDDSRPILDVLKEFLRSRHLLIIVDNCEHLLSDCAYLVRELLAACSHVRILASSREALAVPGEVPYHVPSLAVPGREKQLPVAELDTYDAVRLFVARARIAQPSFTLNEDNAPAVAQICRRLDGIPLALELAAARVKVLSVEQIATRLDDRFRLLTGGSRTALPRQQTLQALIDWSYSLLSDTERLLFRRLSAFVGGWSLEAAEAVCCGNGIEPYDVLDLLASLVDKSLVTKEEHFGEARFRRLETVRQYARDKLLESGEAASVRHRHCHWFLGFAETAAPKLEGPEAPAWFNRLEMEHDNLRAALEWSLASDEVETAARLATALARFWDTHGHLAEGRRWLRTILETGQTLPPKVQADVLHRMGWLSTKVGEYAEAVARAEKSLALYRALPDDKGISWSLEIMATAHLFNGELQQADALLHEALEHAYQSGKQPLIAFALGLLGTLEFFRGNYPASIARLEEQLPLKLAMGDEHNKAWSKLQLGFALVFDGDHHRAASLLRESLEGYLRLNNRWFMTYCLLGLAWVALEQGAPGHAAKLSGAIETVRESIGAHFSPTIRQAMHIDRLLATTKERLGEAAFDQAWQEGRAMRLQQAIALALSVGQVG